MNAIVFPSDILAGSRAMAVGLSRATRRRAFLRGDRAYHCVFRDRPLSCSAGHCV